jgi:hypothetical protein
MAASAIQIGRGWKRKLYHEKENCKINVSLANGTLLPGRSMLRSHRTNRWAFGGSVATTDKSGNSARSCESTTGATRLARGTDRPLFRYGVMDVSKFVNPLRQQVVTGVSDSLKKALELAEDCALYYLSDEIEKVTIPLWIEDVT